MNTEIRITKSELEKLLKSDIDPLLEKTASAGHVSTARRKRVLRGGGAIHPATRRQRADRPGRQRPGLPDHPFRRDRIN